MRNPQVIAHLYSFMPFSSMIFPLISGWWFGTCFIFHNIWDVILPIDELIFFRGVAQPPTRYFPKINHIQAPQQVSCPAWSFPAHFWQVAWTFLRQNLDMDASQLWDASGKT